jgi:hypothetical protein
VADHTAKGAAVEGQGVVVVVVVVPAGVGRACLVPGRTWTRVPGTSSRRVQVLPSPRGPLNKHSLGNLINDYRKAWRRAPDDHIIVNPIYRVSIPSIY